MVGSFDSSNDFLDGEPRKFKRNGQGCTMGGKNCSFKVNIKGWQTRK